MKYLLLIILLLLLPVVYATDYTSPDSSAKWETIQQDLAKEQLNAQQEQTAQYNKTAFTITLILIGAYIAYSWYQSKK